uniref:Uncharacterized protein n=1 Tax=Magallana gigas TaxID=29159 RepID=A0A8W8MHG8_MAGGI
MFPLLEPIVIFPTKIDHTSPLSRENMNLSTYVQKADAGNLTCDVYEKDQENEQWVRDELVAIKSLAIQVRGYTLIWEGAHGRCFCNTINNDKEVKGHYGKDGYNILGNNWRRPIKSMMFRFDANKDEYLTLDNNEALHNGGLIWQVRPLLVRRWWHAKANVQSCGRPDDAGEDHGHRKQDGHEICCYATGFRGQ